MKRHQSRLGGKACHQKGDREQHGPGEAAGGGPLELPEVQRPGRGVEHRAADENAETGDAGEYEVFEGRLHRNRAFQKEARQAVAGQCGHLEPDEQIDRVRRERGADERRQQQLDQAREAAQFPWAEIAEFGERADHQRDADSGGQRGEREAERVGHQGDSERCAAHRLLVGQEVRQQMTGTGEHPRGEAQQHRQRCAQRGHRDPQWRPPRSAGGQRGQHRADQWNHHWQRKQLRGRRHRLSPAARSGPPRRRCGSAGPPGPPPSRTPR